uniref:Thioredoxin-disulfide reductase n=1 Tax=Gadus morhua TaxID=8049 RepID=A0A8C5A0U7_GADMO
MPPVEKDAGKTGLKTRIQELIESNQVVVFSKSYCPFCVKVKDLFKDLDVKCNVVELDLVDEGTNYQELLVEMTGQKTVPNVFINKTHVGGWDKTKQEAATLGKKVMVLDYVVPTPKGTTWGLGGTCVNVGCIPKKLMHQTALLGTAMQDARKYGWEFDESVKHNWVIMKEAINNYIGSLNWGYRVALRDKNVNYVNAYAEFVEPHKIKATTKRGKETMHTAARFVLATGERPRYLGIPGDKEFCITSDDLFSLPYCPGKTLLIGASYVALECAGFLAGLGLDVTVMVRSILLRGFDQEMANRAGEHMEEHGVKFLRKYVPVKVEELEAGTPGRLRVTAKSTESDELLEGEYNTEREGPRGRRGADQRALHLRHRRHPGGQVGADARGHPGRQAAGTAPLRRGLPQGTRRHSSTTHTSVRVCARVLKREHACARTSSARVCAYIKCVLMGTCLYAWAFVCLRTDRLYRHSSAQNVNVMLARALPTSSVVLVLKVPCPLVPVRLRQRAHHGVHAAGVRVLRPVGGEGHRDVRRGEPGGEHLSEEHPATLNNAGRWRRVHAAFNGAAFSDLVMSMEDILAQHDWRSDRAKNDLHIYLNQMHGLSLFPLPVE